MNQILQDKPMTIFGDGAQQRAFTYIGDILPVIACCPFAEACRNRVFNVGADQPYSVNYLAHQAAKAMGVQPRIEHSPSPSEVAQAYSDHSAVRAHLRRDPANIP